MKKYIFAFLLLLFAFLTLCIQQNRIKKFNNEIAVYEENQSAFLNDIIKYKTKDSLNVASIARLTLEVNELDIYRESLLSQIKELNIKLKHVQSITNTQIATEANVKAIVKDTVLIHDTVPCFEYRDKHISVTGCILIDTVDLNIRSITNLTQVVHRIPKRFLCFNFGVKAIRQEIMSDNPYTDIVFAEYIELK